MYSCYITHYRWRVDAGNSNDPRDATSQPSLALEGLVLKGGPRLDSLPPETRRILASGSCQTFLLWKTSASWYMPCSRAGMVTTPGICVVDSEVFPAPSPHLVRWHVQHVLDQCRRGCYVSETSDWDTYVANPTSIMSRTSIPFLFVVPVSKSPVFKLPTGMSSSVLARTQILNML